jgi:hypothetical protein
MVYFIMDILLIPIVGSKLRFVMILTRLIPLAGGSLYHYAYPQFPRAARRQFIKGPAGIPNRDNGR